MVKKVSKVEDRIKKAYEMVEKNMPKRKPRPKEESPPEEPVVEQDEDGDYLCPVCDDYYDTKEEALECCEDEEDDDEEPDEEEHEAETTCETSRSAAGIVAKGIGMIVAALMALYVGSEVIGAVTESVNQTAVVNSTTSAGVLALLEFSSWWAVIPILVAGMIIIGMMSMLRG